MFRLSPKLKSALIISISGPIGFVGLSLYDGSDKFYRQFVMPNVHRFLEPEQAHNFAVKMAKLGLVPNMARHKDDESLNIDALGRKFSNPIGCAAGFDKHAEAMGGLFKLGFGFVEIGTIVPLAQEGNPKPRVFRLTEDRAIINRYGFNSEGHQVVFDRVKQFQESKKEKSQIVGVNLGKNKTTESPTDDYVKGLKLFSQHADYIVVNISSPNTPGLRGLQKSSELQTLLDKVLDERKNTNSKVPILVKIAPDLSDDDLRDIAKIVTRENKAVDGLIICNTTISRSEDLQSKLKTETGGLSGRPLKNMSNLMIKKMWNLTNGKMAIIGVGGVESGEDVLEKLKCGASLVQLYSAMIYDGPTLINRIKNELREVLKKEGFDSAQQAIGHYHKDKLI